MVDGFIVWNASDPDDRAAWLRRWESLPNREVFAHPGYGELFVGDGDRLCCASFLTVDDGVVLYPFVRRQIPAIEAGATRHCDITSPYGYGGPYTANLSHREQVASAFWQAFDEWAQAEGVVAEFVRFDLHSESLLSYPGDILARANNVVRSLDLDGEALWMDFEQKVRKNVKKAQRSGITIEVDLTGKYLSEFLALYEGTMDRREAREDYYFGQDFFEAVISALPGQFAFFHAFDGQRMVSTELVLVSQRSVYSFLGGTDSASFASRPNDLLKYEIILWAKNEGKADFVLGGGATAGDGIERYKRSFAPGGLVTFETGQRIFDQKTTDELTSAAQIAFSLKQREWPENSSYFPPYRMPL